MNYQLSNLWRWEDTSVLQPHWGKKNLFIRQITVSHHWIKWATSLIRKEINVCTVEAFLCGLMAYSKGNHLTNIYTAEKQISYWIYFLALYHITEIKMIHQKAASRFTLKYTGLLSFFPLWINIRPVQQLKQKTSLDFELCFQMKTAQEAKRKKCLTAGVGQACFKWC